MWVPKGCQRCGGDLYKTSTDDGTVATCLQCGREFLAAPRRSRMSRDELYALFHEEDKRSSKAA